MLNLQMPDGKTIQCPEGVTTLQLAAKYASRMPSSPLWQEYLMAKKWTSRNHYLAMEK
jgi:hypothetical protein